jgi:TRAP-type C4-dicarboxylate transport system permease small subunit
MNNAGGLVYRAIVGVGALALLAAMAIDVIAVAGRHTGIPLLGSIEVVQVMVGIAGAMALLISTLQNSHAKVRLLLVRLSDTHRNNALRCGYALTALFFLALTLGSGWILAEMWNSHEESELWHLPYRPLRLLVVVTLAFTTLLMLRKAWQGEQP